MKVRIYVDNHKLKENVPWVVEVDGERRFAKSIEYAEGVKIVFYYDPHCERPNCTVDAENVAQVLIDDDGNCLLKARGTPYLECSDYNLLK